MGDPDKCDPMDCGDAHRKHVAWVLDLEFEARPKYLRIIGRTGGVVMSIWDIPPNWNSRAPLRNLARRSSRIIGQAVSVRDLQKVLGDL